MVSSALAGVTVIDFTRFVSGSYSTMLMSMLGAEVIKVERLPSGDPYRVTGADETGASALFNCLNSGKKSLALDFDNPDDRALLQRLIGTADVFVENARPGSLRRYDLDHESLRERFPSLVYASISAFGDIGPSRTKGGFDLVLQAESGVMSVTGDPASGPSKMGLPFLDLGAGMSCLVAVLAALAQRATTGEGAHISSSLFEFGLAGFVTQVDGIVRQHEVPGLLGSHSPSFAPYGYFRCADRGIIIAGAGADDLWRRMCDVLDAPQLLDDERFRSNADRLKHRDELTATIEGVLATATADHWLDLLDAAGIPAGEVRSADEALTGEQAQALGSVYERTTDGASYWNVAAPFRIDGDPIVAPGAAPKLGEHTDELRTRVENL